MQPSTSFASYWSHDFTEADIAEDHMRKTKIHAILTEISQGARKARKISDCTCIREYNDVKNKKYILNLKDKISELCTKLENEVFD